MLSVIMLSVIMLICDHTYKYLTSLINLSKTNTLAYVAPLSVTKKKVL
jgi:hypothetical protein